jgi:ABC-type microcin C transport system permease subunit YejE
MMGLVAPDAAPDVSTSDHVGVTASGISRTMHTALFVKSAPLAATEIVYCIHVVLSVAELSMFTTWYLVSSLFSWMYIVKVSFTKFLRMPPMFPPPFVVADMAISVDAL